VNGRRVMRVLGALVVLPVLVTLTALAGASAAGSTAGTVFIRTVPALPGVSLLVSGVQVTTDGTGSARVGVADINNAASQVSLADKALDARSTLSVAYVKPDPHSGRHESHLTVGLDVTSQVTLRLSPGTSGVAPSTVHVVRLHSVTGQTIQVDPQRTRTVSLLSRKARFVAGVVTAQVVTWSVDSLRAGPGVSVTTTSRSGFDPLASDVWPLLLQPVAGTVVIDTVPATPGVSFRLGGATFTTDAKGRATGPVSDLNALSTRLALNTPDTSSGSSVALLRVASAAAGGPFRRRLIAGLAVSRPVSLSFTDRTGQAVPADRVGTVVLAGDGKTVTVTAAQLQDHVALLAEKASLEHGVWTPQQVTYAVTSVTVEGSDAVFAGQQRFNPNGTDEWRIALSVFNVSVTVRDVLFGSRIASAATVTRPDGVQYAVQLDGDQPTVLRSLVRGQYVLTTKSAVAGARSTILVSKNSDVELRVVTLRDVLVIAALTAAIAISVVLLGRRWAQRPGPRRARSRT
jgi:hypothetical protein